MCWAGCPFTVGSDGVGGGCDAHGTQAARAAASFVPLNVFSGTHYFVSLEYCKQSLLLWSATFFPAKAKSIGKSSF